MSNEKLEKISKYLLLAIFFTPVIYIGGFYYPFIITKTLFFRFLIQLAFSIYIILLISNYSRYKPRINKALVIVFLLLLSSFVSAILGLDFYKSFWSSFERMEGVVGNIYIFLYLFLLIQFFREKKDWFQAFRVIIIAGFLASAYAIIQRFGILPVFQSGVSRAAGTLGNAAFLAGYMLLSFGLSLYHYFRETNKSFKAFTLVSSLLFIFTLFLTATRGAILGVLIAFVWFLLVYAIFGNKVKMKRYSIIILLLFIFASFLFYFYRDNFKDSNIEIVKRIATISIQDATVKNRLMVWQMVISEFKNYPLFGIGLENFNVIYNKHFTPKINENWFDRTHNIYLDNLIQNGIIGLILYLLILFYLFILLWKKRKENFNLFLIFSSLLIAYAVHNFFVFDVLSTFIMFVFIIGFIAYDKSEEEQISKKELSNALQIFVILILLISNIYIFYKLIYKPYQINKDLYTGYYYILADSDLSYDKFKSALSQRYGSTEAALQLSKMYDVLVEEGDTIDYGLKTKFQNLLEEKLKFAIENNPLDVRLRLHLAQFLINYKQSAEDMQLAIENLEKSIGLSPKRPDAYYLLFNLYLKLNDNKKAIDSLERLIAELPWYNQAKLMILNALVEEDPEKAEKYYQEGIQNGIDSSTVLEVLEYLLNQKRYDETIVYYDKLISFYPDRYDYRIDLAKVYVLTGQTDKAIEQVNIINAHNPLLLQNEPELINNLNSY